jgi:methionyl-tRNA formyltransferase
MMRIVFMGSAEFSVPSLLALHMGYELVGVVTQPDRPAGRGRKLTANPVKRMAQATGVPLSQPASLHASEAVDQLRDWRPDLVVVAAFGQILRKEVLLLPEYGCINVHASLLPRWRGAAPAAAAILAGDSVTGVTLIKMDAGLDTGPILARNDTPLEPDDTTASLTARLAEMGAQLLVDTLPSYLEGDLTPRPQPDTGVTFAPQLTKESGLIDWHQPVDRIDRQVRAYNPWPAAHTFWRGQRLTVWEMVPLPYWMGPESPGTVFAGEVSPMVATGEGAAWLIRLQPAGKAKMGSEHFVVGRPGFVGSVLGAEE